MLGLARALRHPLTPERYLPLVVNGETVGQVTRAFADARLASDPFFCVGNGAVSLDGTFESITKKFRQVNEQLREEGLIEGWRDEDFPAIVKFGENPRFIVERSAVTFWGLRAHGIHVNVYRQCRDGGIEIFIAKRSASKQTFPGKLDNCVAGGQPFNITLMENVVKECNEEASIESATASLAKPAGCISYMRENSSGLRPRVMHMFDLEVPSDFFPIPRDGEVESFTPLSPQELLASLESSSSEWKPNSALVCASFLVRRGFAVGNHDEERELFSPNAYALGDSASLFI